MKGRVLSIFDEDGNRVAQIDADGGVAHVIHEHGAPIEVTVSIRRGDATLDAELPTCHDPWCDRCHPTRDISARPAWGEVPTPQPAAPPSAFAYLGEPHA